jgi:excisionase family DNA binding protein
MSGLNATGTKYLTVAEAAAILGISVETVRGLIHDKRLRAVNVGRGGRNVYRIPADAVIEDARKPLPPVREFV